MFGEALAGELERVRAAELVRRKPPPHTSLSGELVELEPHRGARPRSPAGGPIDDAEQLADRQFRPRAQPRL
jgi:hypothetical protein